MKNIIKIRIDDKDKAKAKKAAKKDGRTLSGWIRMLIKGAVK